MASRGARLSRGSLVAVFAVLTAAVSHTVAGGEPPSMQVVALAIAFALVACVPLAGRRRSIFSLAAMVGLSQLLLHGLFALFGSGGDVAATGGHHGAALLLDSSGPIATPHPDMAALMTIAHAIAALATLVLVRFGESAAQALVALLHLIVRTLTRLVAAPTFEPATRGRDDFPAIRSSLRVVFLGAHADRGPPLALGL
jgi:hypothetical protein